MAHSGHLHTFFQPMASLSAQLTQEGELTGRTRPASAWPRAARLSALLQPPPSFLSVPRTPRTASHRASAQVAPAWTVWPPPPKVNATPTDSLDPGSELTGGSAPLRPPAGSDPTGNASSHFPGWLFDKYLPHPRNVNSLRVSPLSAPLKLYFLSKWRISFFCLPFSSLRKIL